MAGNTNKIRANVVYWLSKFPFKLGFVILILTTWISPAEYQLFHLVEYFPPFSFRNLYMKMELLKQIRPSFLVYSFYISHVIIYTYYVYTIIHEHRNSLYIKPCS